MNAILYNGTLWVAGGTNIKYSSNALDWTNVVNGPTSVNSLAWTGSEWLASCDGSNNLYSSNNAIQWYLIGALSAYNIYKIAYNNNTIFALSDSTVYYSIYSNTSSWNSYSDPSLGSITDYAYTGIYHTFTSGSYVLLTQDLVSWSKVAKPSAGSFISANMSNIGTATIKPLTIACADSSLNTLLYSYDGIMWHGSGTSMLNKANAVEWNGSIWIAVGTGTNTWYTLSRDGMHWQKQNDATLTEGISIAWNGSMWLAGGIGQLAKSADGITWTLVDLSMNGASYVAWNGYKWLVSAGSNVYSSTNLTSWTQEALASGNIQVATIQNYTESSDGPASGAFDASLASAWTPIYDASSEWLQVDMGSFVQVNHYAIKTNATTWVLQGSADAVTWTTLDTRTFDVSANDILLTFINTTAYRYYKLTFDNLATALQVYNLAFYTSLGTARPLAIHKSWTASFTNVGYVQYLDIASAHLNGRGLQTTCPVATSYSYNGIYSVITDASNAYYSTHDFSFGSAITSMSKMTSATYNGTYFIVGGSSVQYAHPSNMTAWYNTVNVGTLLGGGTIQMLKSNTGIGFNASPNTLHLVPGEKLSIVAPKFYDQNMEKRGTMFMFSLV
jgi:hypothetical protein